MNTRAQKRQRDLEVESDELVAKMQKTLDAWIDQADSQNKVEYDVSTQTCVTDLWRMNNSYSGLEIRIHELECELTQRTEECKQLRRRLAIITSAIEATLSFADE